MNNVVVIVQARMGSSRLPGKILKKIIGKPMLVHQIERISRAKKIDAIVIATTKKPGDDQVVTLCEENRWNFFRGSENDLLDRYYQTALIFHADVIVRLTADCPLIDPEIIDQTINVFQETIPHIDFVSNSLPVQTFPRGLDTEVMSMEALKRAWLEDKNPQWREHVTPYIERNPTKFIIKGLTYIENLSNMRWTVDTPEDLHFIREVFNYFKTNDFSWLDVLTLINNKPKLQKINCKIEQKQIE